MLVGKELAYFQRLVCTLVMLKWYGGEMKQHYIKLGRWLVQTYTRWRHQLQPLCVFRNSTRANQLRLLRQDTAVNALYEKIRFISFFLLTLLVVGCAAPEWKAHCKSVSGFSNQMNCRQNADAEHNLQILGNTCTSYGFEKGTTAFAQCLMQIDQQNTINQQLQSQQLFEMSQKLLAPVQTNVITCVPTNSVQPGAMYCH